MNASCGFGKAWEQKGNRVEDLRTCSNLKNKHCSCLAIGIFGTLVFSENRTPVKTVWGSDEPLMKEVPHSGSRLDLVSFLNLGESFQLSLKTRELHWGCVRCRHYVILDFELFRLGLLVFLCRLSGLFLAFPGLFCSSSIPQGSSV